jgi:large subunit ribosomal protein L7/L12
MASDRLGKLLERRDALAARIRREQAKATAQERKADTRRKILAGAVVIERAERDPAFKGDLYAWLSDMLKRDDDRALFGLVPLPSEGSEAGGNAAADTDARNAA